jgi:hypothetical protein
MPNASGDFTKNCRHFFAAPRSFAMWCLMGAWCVSISAAQSFEIKPSSEAFPAEAVGTQSPTHALAVYNTGTTPLTITSFSLTPTSDFQLTNGFAPVTVAAGAKYSYNMAFGPSAAGVRSGQLTITIQGVPSPQVVPLTGTGFITKAVASLSTNSITFPSLGQGTASATKSVVITNTGKGPFTLEGVNADPPFTVTGFSGKTILNAGNSLTVQVGIYGTYVGSFTGELTFTMDVLPAKGVDLVGTVTSPTALSVGAFPILPSATQSALYQASATGVGGTPPYTFSLAQGSTLPLGLNLSSTGAISGTLDSSVGVGSYPFTVQVTDAGANKTTEQLTLPVGAQTGSDCNNIFWNIGKSNHPIIPLNDLGTGTYSNEEGGLYPNGSNVRPSSFDAYGVGLAQAIQPLDANGNPSPTGKYVLLSVGHSESKLEFVQFASDAKADPSVNPNLVIVNGALDEVTAAHWKNPSDPAWATVLNYFLPQAGVTANQVVAMWVKSVDSKPAGAFPGNLTNLQADLESLSQTLHTLFPNLVLTYWDTRFYGAYANGLPLHNYTEPQAYESGFAVKWSIQDQINGNANLNYNPALGPVMAPWMSWASYDWTNGLLPRSDGLTWTCQDSQSDGVHPSVPSGVEKGANLLLNKFKTDDTTTPWFLTH